jgi:hypothetical protein
LVPLDQTFADAARQNGQGGCAGLSQRRQAHRDVMNLRAGQHLVCFRTQQKGFGRGPLGPDHLMAIKEQVDIAHLLDAVVQDNSRQANQFARRNQSRTVSGKGTQGGRGDQHPVLA